RRRAENQFPRLQVKSDPGVPFPIAFARSSAPNFFVRKRSDKQLHSQPGLYCWFAQRMPMVSRTDASTRYAAGAKPRRVKNKMPDVDSHESSSGIAVDVQQRLNCALPSPLKPCGLWTTPKIFGS